MSTPFWRVPSSAADLTYPGQDNSYGVALGDGAVNVHHDDLHRGLPHVDLAADPVAAYTDNDADP